MKEENNNAITRKTMTVNLMKQLLTLSLLATALLFAQPAQAQQHENHTEDSSMNHMEMMQDSTMAKSMIKKMMNNPQTRQIMMHSMMKWMMNNTENMHGDMMKDEMANCMEMWMNMKQGHMNMDHDMDHSNMNHMPKKQE